MPSETVYAPPAILTRCFTLLFLLYHKTQAALENLLCCKISESFEIGYSYDHRRKVCNSYILPYTLNWIIYKDDGWEEIHIKRTEKELAMIIGENT
eukprot:c31564_g1_i1 orf=51-338(+)